MNHYYTFLALDLARDRALEAARDRRALAGADVGVGAVHLQAHRVLAGDHPVEHDHAGRHRVARKMARKCGVRGVERPVCVHVRTSVGGRSRTIDARRARN